MKKLSVYHPHYDPPTEKSIDIRFGMSVKEKADAYIFNRELGRRDYDNFGGLSYPTHDMVDALIARIRELEAQA